MPRVFASSRGGPSAFSRRRLLAGSGAVLGLPLLGLPRQVRAAGEEGPDHLVIWWNRGGWDTSYAFDPHFDSAYVMGDESASAATSGDLLWASSASRPSVDGVLETYGARACIVNGVHVGSIAHEACTLVSLTGQRSVTRPDLPTMLAYATGGALALPYLNLAGPRYVGVYGDVLAPVNHILGGTLHGSLPASATVDPAQEDLVEAYLASVGDAFAAESGPDSRAAGWRLGLDRIAQLKDHSATLAIPADPTPEHHLALAVRAIEEGLSRAILVEAPLPLQTIWDSHIDNHYNQVGAYETSFLYLRQLLDSLDALPSAVEGQTLLDRTLVLAMSEMGRTPVLNTANGKDHWPYTSMLAIGGGIEGGRVLGATDDTLLALPIDLETGRPDDLGVRLRPANLVAGLLERFGVDPSEWLPGETPFRALFA